MAVVCPSRGRVEYCSRLVESVINTSDAHALLYFDDDAPHPMSGAWNGPRVHATTGPRIGRGAAINALCETHKYYDAYLLVSDDASFNRKGWDDELGKALESFPDGIGLAHIKYSPEHTFVSWPCVTRKWIDAVGWFNPPTLRSYCQDTALQAMAEAIGRIAPIAPAIHHSEVYDAGSNARIQSDTNAFLWFMALEFGPAVRRLKAVMA